MGTENAKVILLLYLNRRDAETQSSIRDCGLGISRQKAELTLNFEP
jgi:hypothetical protein